MTYIARWNQLKATMDPVDLKRQQALIDAAHQEAVNILQGKFPDKVSGFSELARVKSALGEAPPLNTATGMVGYVDNLGQIWDTQKYEQLDIGWVDSLIYYNEYKNNKGSFGGDAQVITIPNDVNIAILGDWGTGYWRGNDTPAAKVAAQVLASNPDYTIHIGDTYYAGTQDEMTNNLANIWPKGKSGSFAIPGNHEMYCGDIYYNAILPTLCPLQNGVSYFALQNDNWFIISLDSAYYATGDMYMDGSIMNTQNSGDPGPQVLWLLDVLKNVGTRKVIIISHHQPMDLSGNQLTNLFGEVNVFLKINNLQPALWYFGHEHNAAIYSQYSVMYYPGRCIGHAAIPYGIASDLTNATGGAVLWAETASANDSEYPQRILNGYMSLSISGTSITETLYSENGDVRWTQTS